MGSRKELTKWEREEGKEAIEGIVERKIKYGRDSLRIVGVYVNGDTERKLEGLRGWMEGKEDGTLTIIGGILMLRRAGREVG